MGAYIRKITARKCPVHRILLEMAKEDLTKVGYFNKDDLLERAHLKAMGNSIRWDYIAEFIRDDDNCDLVPLAARFWKMSPEKRVVRPDKALAGGHGKKTAGYALVCEENAALSVHKLKRRRSTANGVGEAFRKLADRIEEENIDKMLEEESRQDLLGPVVN